MTLGVRIARTSKVSKINPAPSMKAISLNGASGMMASIAKLPASVKPAVVMARMLSGKAERIAWTRGRSAASFQIPPTANTL